MIQLKRCVVDIVQLMKTEHAKTTGLFDRIEQTSNNAVKTRERLFGQLKTGLEIQSKVSHDLVYPILRKHEEIRQLVPDQKERVELRRRLQELEQTPKEDEQFLPRIKELKKVITQQLRDEERQIFPAIKKAIGSSEAEELAERAARETKEEWQNAAQAEDEDDASDRSNGGPEVRKMSDTAREARRMSSEAAQTAQEAMRGARQSGQEIFGAVQDGTRGLEEAAQLYNDAGRRVGEELQTLLVLPNAAAGAIRTINGLWTDWYGREMRRTTEAARQMMRCSNPRDLAEVQTKYVTECLQGLVEQSADCLTSAQRASEEALAPLQTHLKASKREARTSHRDKRDAG
jgi:hypothetical protein